MKYLILILILAMTTANVQISQELLLGKYKNPTNKLEERTQAAFNKMQTAAAKDGIKIEVASGYRSFDRQRQIWNGKYEKYAAQGLKPNAIFDKIVEYSTVPGTSRHHWGTDIDLIDCNATYSGSVLVTDKFHGNGPFCKFKEWMEVNASNFGFELVYTLSENRTGFEYEPWHYSYAPISKQYLADYLTQIDFVPFLRSQNILGMDKISDERLNRYFKEHVQGINPALQSEKE